LLLSDGGVPLEDIADLVGYSGSAAALLYFAAPTAYETSRLRPTGWRSDRDRDVG
jgi:hypothetical protein